MRVALEAWGAKKCASAHLGWDGEGEGGTGGEGGCDGGEMHG